jgi:hypothetical protein
MELKDSAKKVLQSRCVNSPSFESRLYRVYLIQYVLTLASTKCITIGLLAYEPESRFLTSRFKIDIDAIEKLHPCADKEFLTELPTYFDSRIRLHRTNPEEFLAEIESYSNLVQATQPMLCWLNNPELEVENILKDSQAAQVDASD